MRSGSPTASLWAIPKPTLADDRPGGHLADFSYPVIALPILFFLILVARYLSLKTPYSFPDAFVRTYLWFYLVIWISTEALSLTGSISPLSFALVWAMACVLAGFQTFRDRALKWRQFLNGLKIPAPYLCILAILLGTLFTGFVYPPNNWDSMTYHMSRVEHWITHGSVDFFPTHITRQNDLMPLAEYGILHLRVLSGNDYFANAVQWLGFLATISAVYLIAAELGARKWGRFLSVTFFATAPMAILQASSTQNDDVTASFVLIFTFFILRLKKDFSASNLAGVALSLGLAILTKGTAYVYCAGIGLALAAPIIFERNLQIQERLKRFAGLATCVALSLLINAGFYARSVELHGAPLPPESSKYQNEEKSLTTLFSNAVRNTALHFALPSPTWNKAFDQAVYDLLGKETNNPKTSWPGTQFHSIYSKHEDGAGNLQQVLIAGFAFLLFLYCLFRHKTDALSWYFLGFAASAFLYCWLLKWQPWASRLHTPLFAYLAPFVGIVYERFLHRQSMRGIQLVFISTLLLYGYACTLDNMTRSLISMDWANKPREALFYYNRPHLAKPYAEAVDSIVSSGATRLGLYAGENDWEYPLWALISMKTEEDFHIDHVFVNNSSASLLQDSELPEILVATKSYRPDERYTPLYESQHISVLKLKNPSHK